jgi:SH3-like domain-containing protein
VKLRRRPSAEADAVAIAEKDVVMEIQFCEKEWCKLASDEVKGWALRTSFWGMLEGEVLK